MKTKKISLSALGLLLYLATATAAPAQTFTTLAIFKGDASGPLVQGTDGNFYGTGRSEATGDGIIFKITPAGTLRIFHSFNDDGVPSGGLILSTDGKFYGTTYGGGAYNYGIVFTITRGGRLTTLHSFDGIDGAVPVARLVQANGNFYGTTTYGGANNWGTVFKITPAGTLTTLYSFCTKGGTACTDGNYPLGTLVQRISDCSLYGTTYVGGANDDGTVFKTTFEGQLTTLHSFDGSDGSLPNAGLTQGTDGNFYGTTPTGGPYDAGTVFKITPAGILTTIHSFNGTDGSCSIGGVVLGTDGNFYGTTEAAFTNTIFQVTPAGTLTTVNRMGSGSSGCSFQSQDGLIQGTDGKFYGTYQNGDGTRHPEVTVFSLDMSLGPFVKTLPTVGRVGRAVKILGNKLTGASSVTFNGTPATFTVVSDTEITATVPSDATTGKVEVTTPSGTLTSNVNFRVS